MTRKSTANQNLLMPKPEALGFGCRWNHTGASLADGPFSQGQALYPILRPCTLSWGSSGAMYFYSGSQRPSLSWQAGTPSWDHVTTLGSSTVSWGHASHTGQCIPPWVPCTPSLAVAYPRAQVPNPSEPVLEARNPSQGRDLSSRLQMPLPGGTGWRHIPTVASAP